VSFTRLWRPTFRRLTRLEDKVPPSLVSEKEVAAILEAMAAIETRSDSLKKSLTTKLIKTLFRTSSLGGEFIRQSRAQWVLMGEPWAAQPSRRIVVTKVDINTTRRLTDHSQVSCSLQEWR